MLSFQKAREVGCHGIELDVHLSADGVPVVIHDEQVDRTTDGSGWVGELSFAQLRKLDASGRFRGVAGPNRIPALQEVLEWCEATGLRLNLELKTNVCEYPGIEQKTIEMVFSAGMQERVILSSFNHYTLLRCKNCAADSLRRAGRKLDREFRRICQGTGAGVRASAALVPDKGEYGAVKRTEPSRSYLDGERTGADAPPD